MRIFCKSLFIISFIAISACTEKPVASDESPAKVANLLTGNQDETRIISIQSPTQCNLIIKHGRRVESTITPKSCQLTQSADGFISSVTVIFDAPCKQYVFKNVIGARYFLDEKSIASKNSACVLETFNASYSWNLEDKTK